MVQGEHNITYKMQWTHVGVLLDRGNGIKPSSLQAFAHRPALVRSKCGFENLINNTFFIRSVSAYRELLIAAVLVVTIVQHRTSVLDKTACACSKTSRVEHTKSVHNRPKPAVFVRTALGLSSNQNEVAINSKSGLWRTALLKGSPRMRSVVVSFVRHSPAFATFARAFGSILNIRKGFARNSPHWLLSNRKLRKKFAGIRKKFASIRNHL